MRAYWLRITQVEPKVKVISRNEAIAAFARAAELDEKLKGGGRPPC
ncbi:MAG: hypothetical protein U0361_21605 [Nitrospiraceae bacterium]